MNAAALLALLSDLYAQVDALAQENAKLRGLLAQEAPEADGDVHA